MKTLRTFVTNRDNLLSLGLTGQVFGKRPSDLLKISNNDALAMDLDLAAAKEVLKWQNQRDLDRLKSLVNSFRVLLAEVFGGSEAAKKVLEELRSQEQNEDPDGSDPNEL